MARHAITMLVLALCGASFGCDKKGETTDNATAPADDVGAADDRPAAASDVTAEAGKTAEPAVEPATGFESPEAGAKSFLSAAKASDKEALSNSIAQGAMKSVTYIREKRGGDTEYRMLQRLFGDMEVISTEPGKDGATNVLVGRDGQAGEVLEMVQEDGVWKVRYWTEWRPK